MAFDHRRRSRAYSILPPTQNDVSTKRKVGDCWMDLPYRTSSDSVLAAIASPPLLRSESDIVATNARGSSGVDPGSVRLWIVTLTASSKGDWLNGERKRLVFLRSSMFSAFAMLRFTFLAVRGGATDWTLMRPTKGLLRLPGVCEGTAPSSA